MQDPHVIVVQQHVVKDGAKSQGQYGHAWMREAIRPRQEMERGKTDPREELRRYLEGPLAEGVVDVVGYWGVSN